MEIQVSQAVLADIPELTNLMQQLKDVNPRPQKLDSERLEKMLASNDDGVLKVQVGLAIVGVCAFSFHFSIWHGGKIGYIHAMVVANEFRNQGIGSRLLEELVRFAKNSGIVGLELDSGFAREKAHSFYESQGFKKVSFLFSRRI